MAKINLLPWREELRVQRNQEFYVAIGIVVFIAAALTYLIANHYEGALQAQNYRNNFVTRETQVLDEKIAEIRELQDTRKELNDRMEVIQKLQGNRPVIVRVFDDVARSMPDDLFLTTLTIVGDQVTIEGIAKSNNRVAALMRNFDGSEWFDEPELKRVKATDTGVNEFEVAMKRIEPKADADKEAP